MKVITIEDATVLTPNIEHKNFTQTDIIIPKGMELDGEVKLVNGLRKGEPFQYRLFYTKDNQIIYTNKIKPTKMETTEIKLGIDGDKPLVIDLPKITKDRNALYGAALGAAAGFAWTSYKGKDAKSKLVYTLGGAVLGLLAGRLVTKRKDITIKK